MPKDTLDSFLVLLDQHLEKFILEGTVVSADKGNARVRVGKGARFQDVAVPRGVTLAVGDFVIAVRSPYRQKWVVLAPFLDRRYGNSSPWEMTYARRAVMWHEEATILAGNALTSNVPADQWHQLVLYQNPGANGDTFTNACFLQAGVYTFSALGVKATNRGKVDWFLDDADTAFIAGQDWYASSNTYNVVLTGEVAVDQDGYHTLMGVVNGKNGSSSGYYMALTKYGFKQAGD